MRNKHTDHKSSSYRPLSLIGHKDKNSSTTKTFMKGAWKSLLASVTLMSGLASTQAESLHVRVTVENLMPENGALITPPWIGLHEGGFDLFDPGSKASASLESLAEDGNPSGLSTDFQPETNTRQDAVLNSIGPIPPGAKVEKDFFLETDTPMHHYLSYAAMIIPSNDAFIGNSNPQNFPIIDGNGNFIELDLLITKQNVYDAGVEMNDEFPENTPALGQMMPNTGQDENGVIRIHAGLMPSGAGGVVDQEAFSNADFSKIDAPIARIRVSIVEPNWVDVTFRVQNQAPSNGVYLTPVWMGFHDGTVRTFETNQPASSALERIAEDGDPSALNAWFANMPGSGMQQVVTSGMQPPVFSPGTSREVTWTLNANDPRNRYLSFVSMVIPSNDAFIANMEPIRVFDDEGKLVFNTLRLGGEAVLDAGTEQNSEAPEDTPLLGQSVPNTGMSEMGIIQSHEGFRQLGLGGVLDNPMFTNADFTQTLYPLFELQANPALSITSVSVSEGELTLNWTGGKPPYQVQQKPNANEVEWTNIGNASDIMSRSWTIDGAQGFYRVVSVGENAAPATAKYRLTFDASWSAVTHPDSFPGNPHFSGLIGATHNETGQIWHPGERATPGIENMAETGSKSPLQNEIQAAIETGWADTLISGSGVGVSPGSTSVEFTARSKHSLLSLVSMIAPSPDWFVGVHGFDLQANGMWVDEVTLTLDPYDAGTDNGTTYTSANTVTSPRDPITRLVSPPVIHEGMVPAFGTFRIKRLD